LEKEVAGSPSMMARQPILGAKLNFLSLSRKAGCQKRAFLIFLAYFYFIWYHYIESRDS
jgi:hypothetical protein